MMQSQLLDVLISQARSPRFEADTVLQKAYNDKRFVRAMKALRSRNIFLYTEGVRTSVNLNNTNTIYTQPTGARLLVLGYSDNMRYGAVTTATTAGPNPTAAVLLQTHRVRVTGPNGDRLLLVQDFVPAQAGVSGQPRFTSTRLPVPFVLEPNEQIAVDLGYDPAGSPEPTEIPPQAFIFFCIKIKERLTMQDEVIALDLQRWIANNPAQRAVFLNCTTPGEVGVGLNFALAAGARVFAETPVANGPMLITGIGTTLGASKLRIIDTADGSSFSLDRFMQSSALNLPGYENSILDGTFGAPVVGPNWIGYYQLPMPHLLIRGAQLKAEIVNGGDAGAGPDTVTEKALFTQLVFAGVSV